MATVDTVRSLLAPDGAFWPRGQDFIAAWMKGRVVPAEVERELDAQVARVRDAGIAIDHLDTHHHLGFLPVVGRAMEAVARRHGIAGIRSAVERPTLAWVTDPRRGLEAGMITMSAWLTRRQLGARRHGPQSWGYVEAGHLDEIRILEIVGRLGPGPARAHLPSRRGGRRGRHARAVAALPAHGRAGVADLGEGPARARAAPDHALPLGRPVLSQGPIPSHPRGRP